MSSNIYSENQSFWNWWLIVLLIVISYLSLEPLISGKEVLNTSSYISIGILICVLLFFLVVRLRTTIDEYGITIRFFPFVRKKSWQWEFINEVYVTEYSILDYGGWGYRVSKKGKAYNTKGKYGIQLILKNGARIMVGTQNPETVRQVIDKLKNQN